jgi:hypothetical protein
MSYLSQNNATTASIAGASEGTSASAGIGVQSRARLPSQDLGSATDYTMNHHQAITQPFTKWDYVRIKAAREAKQETGVLKNLNEFIASSDNPEDPAVLRIMSWQSIMNDFSWVKYLTILMAVIAISELLMAAWSMAK